MSEQTLDTNTPGTDEAAHDAAPAAAESAAAELDALRRENEELRAAERLRNARSSIAADLERAGARSPELLFAAVMGELKFDDLGRATNAADLIGRLRESYPEQFEEHVRTHSIDAGAGRGTQMLTGEALARMSPAEIARLDWAEVRAALSSGK